MSLDNSTPVKQEPPTPLHEQVLGFVVCPALLAITIYFIMRASGAEGLPASVLPIVVSGGLLVFAAAFTAWCNTSGAMQRKFHVRELGLNRRAKYFEDMLHLVADNIPNMLFICDREGRIWFANHETVQQAGKTVDEVLGKTLDRVFLPRYAEPLLQRIRQAQAARAPVVTVDRRDDAAGLHYLETYHIPLPDTFDLHETVMVTQKNITGTIVERERQEQMFRQLVDVLIAVIDRRDPYAAGHSLRVGSVAANLAQHIGLEAAEVEACRVAGSLMNLGKIMVPRSVLVKTTALDTEELKLVRKSILASADILSLISFQIPVIPTLRQVLERYDGTGVPAGRKADNILITSRIIALANAFIALVSPRAHRAGLSVQEAFSALQRDSGGAYDPRLVKSLIEHLQQNPEMQATLVKPSPELNSVRLEDLAD